MPIFVAGASGWLGSAVVAEVTLSQAAPGSSEAVSPISANAATWRERLPRLR
jgi:hypothetical protein